MMAEDPNNPQQLVGGAKFFPSIAHYRFQVGYVSSLDGGCTWIDGGILPGFDAGTSTSDPSFAFGPHHEVYAAVLHINDRQSGISVLKSTDTGRTFGLPVSVFQTRPQKVFSDKPWIVVDQTRGKYSGSVYVVWSYDHGGPCGNGNFFSPKLAFFRSGTSGQNFSPLSFIEGGAPLFTNLPPSYPANSTPCDGAPRALPIIHTD